MPTNLDEFNRGMAAEGYMRKVLPGGTYSVQRKGDDCVELMHDGKIAARAFWIKQGYSPILEQWEEPIPLICWLRLQCEAIDMRLDVVSM